MKKVKLNYTKQGYSYVKCQKIDCLQWGGLAICDDCCKTMQDDVYLIFVLVRAYCPECFKKWENRAKRHTEDLQLQEERQKQWYKAYGFDIEE
mgnify:CR=1 FL=1